MLVPRTSRAKTGFSRAAASRHNELPDAIGQVRIFERSLRSSTGDVRFGSRIHRSCVYHPRTASGLGSTLPRKIVNSQKLRSALLLAICFLLFLFVLQAKTGMYNGNSQAKVTPTTASKLWADGLKWEAPSVSSTTAILFWMVSLFLLALYRKPERWAHRVRQ